MRDCLHAFLLAVEKAFDEQGIQAVLMRMVAREFLDTFGLIRGKPLLLPRSRAVEGAVGLLHWFHSHEAFRGEEHTFESMDPGVRVRIDDHCLHAPRCRVQVRGGLPPACERALEYEAALQRISPEPFEVANRQLDPGQSCSFDLIPVLPLS